jgi:D-glycero-alpha-D-manno-heptose 1-phosphate guanylyltransferase
MSDPGPGLRGVTALVLAGGLGTRLRPVVADRPKALVEVAGRPFITFLLDQLAAAGIEVAILCTGYRGEQVRECLGQRYGGLRLSYSQEPAPLGTAGALRLALPDVQSDLAIVMNGDSYCEAELRAFWSWHRARPAAASLLLTPVADTRRYGRVACDEQGAVTGFVEKSAAGGPGWISAGIYLLGRDLLAEIPAGRAVSIEHEVFPAWVERGLYGCPAGGRFLDFGTPEALAELPAFFAGLPQGGAHWE